MVVGSRTAVVLAEDHPVYREGLQRAVRERPDLELIAAVADGDEALATICRTDPQVAVLDLHMPGCAGPDLIAAVNLRAPDTSVLVLSASQEPELVYAALSAGASGYLAKDSGRTVICDAIVALGRGESVVDARLQAGLVGQIRGRSRAPLPALTDREREILAGVADGETAAEIGRRLFLSPATVKSHLSAIYRKLDVPDRSAAVAVAMRGGLLR